MLFIKSMKTVIFFTYKHCVILSTQLESTQRVQTFTKADNNS